MPPSTPSSSASASCRTDWRPSRWLLAALTLIACGAGIAVLSTGLPGFVAWPLAAATVVAGLLEVRRESRRPPRQLRLGSRRAELDGADVAWCGLRWRGPLAVASVRHPDGRIERLTWWPDTLSPPARRELRLAAAACAASPAEPSVAP